MANNTPQTPLQKAESTAATAEKNFFAWAVMTKALPNWVVVLVAIAGFLLGRLF